MQRYLLSRAGQRMTRPSMSAFGSLMRPTMLRTATVPLNIVSSRFFSSVNPKDSDYIRYPQYDVSFDNPKQEE